MVILGSDFLIASVFDFAAFVYALDNSDRRLIPGGTTIQVGEGVITASLKAEQLVAADIEAWKVECAAEEVILKPLGEDPFVNCPVCATSTRETLSNGEYFQLPPANYKLTSCFIFLGFGNRCIFIAYPATEA
jgi:hypothetical protein